MTLLYASFQSAEKRRKSKQGADSAMQKVGNKTSNADPNGPKYENFDS